MKVLVTGGSGYLGTHIRQFFNADDLSRKNGRDILTLSDLTDIRDYDVVIHMAAHLDKSPESAEQTFLINVEGTLNILQNIREDAALIYLSTKDVYGRFADGFREVPETCPTIYAGQSALEWSKLIGERYVEFYANQNNFRSCIFRLSTTYAPPSDDTVPNFVGHYADAINKGDRLRFPGGGSPVRDVMHVDDLAHACGAFIESFIRHGTYNLGGGRENALSLSELVRKLEAVSGLQAVIDEENPLPPPVPLNYVSDLNLIMKELDWKPEISLADGLKTLF